MILWSSGYVASQHEGHGFKTHLGSFCVEFSLCACGFSLNTLVSSQRLKTHVRLIGNCPGVIKLWPNPHQHPKWASSVLRVQLMFSTQLHRGCKLGRGEFVDLWKHPAVLRLSNNNKLMTWVSNHPAQHQQTHFLPKENWRWGAATLYLSKIHTEQKRGLLK